MKKILTILMSALVLSTLAQGPGTIPEDFKGEISGRANGLAEYYSVNGSYYLSVDGAGSSSLATYNVDVNKPSAAATVHKAFLMMAPLWGSSFNGLSFAGNPIIWDFSAINTSGGTNYIADVTAIVAPILNPAGTGITSISVTEGNTSSIDGIALLVIFEDTSFDEKTIVILFGGLSTTGDNFAITLSEPIDPDVAGAFLNMGLGISYSYQLGGDQQYTIININGERLTTAAGGEDDGNSGNGGLITVGGLGDLNTNPANPFATPTNPRSDDELYSLLPLIDNTITNIIVNTINPSNDDNVFLAYFEISGAAILGEGILISQDENTNCINTMHTVVAQVQDDAGAPVVGTMVDFEVISGPNSGAVASVATNASGTATFTYFGSGGPGFDQIQACFVDSQSITKCSNVITKEWVVCEEVPVSNWALYLGILLMITFVVIRFRRMI